jgi:alkyl hydroperoxide reductase subunit AhpF
MEMIKGLITATEFLEDTLRKNKQVRIIIDDESSGR